MTVLIRDTQNGGFALPETLRQGQNFTDPFGRSGVVNYDTATGKPLSAGGTTLSRPMGSTPIGPSYQNLTGAPANTQVTSFTQALIQMLKEAQQRDTAGQAGLMKQSQDITGQGITDAAANFSNPNLAPSSGTSLGFSAQNEFEPALLSIANQQKLASQNLGNVQDLIENTQDAYNKEEERKQRAIEAAADADYKMKMLKKTGTGNTGFDNDARIREFATDLQKKTGKAKGEPNGDNYVSPEDWMFARDLWQRLGGSDATFETNFKRYLNPLSYGLAGYQDTNTINWGAVPYTPPK